jgi:hypothetical protein
VAISYLKLGGACAILGALLAGGASLALPARYQSFAIIHLQPEGDLRSRLRPIQENLLSRASLGEIIRRPAFDLYPSERMRLPMEDVTQVMRDRDFEIGPADANSFRISFQYPNRYKAQAVVRDVAVRLISAGGLQLVTQPTLPDHPSEPDRLRMSAIGLGAGFALGLLIAFLRTRPLRWTLVMAASALAGCGAAFGVSLLLPDRFDWDQRLLDFVALGGLSGLGVAAFRLRSQPPAGNRYLRLAWSCGCAAAILAGFASFAMPDRYVSTALIRARTKVEGAPSGTKAADRLHELTVAILCRSSLSELIQRPSLDLYRAERGRRPLEGIAEEMRQQALRIEAPPGLNGLAPAASRISFEYSDRNKAQAVVRKVVTKFVEGNATFERLHLPQPLSRAGKSNQYDADAIVIEVLQPASLQETPILPNRIAIVAFGFIGGASLILAIALAQHRAARRYLKYTIAAGAAGAAIALLVSFGIPNRYVSSAVLRLGTPAVTSEAAAERLQHTILDVSGVTEGTKGPVFRHMREGDLRFESLEVSPGGRTTAFRIECETPDREKAWACTEELVRQYVDVPGPNRSGLELLDSPTLPEWPSAPNRLNISAVGLFVGLALGLMASTLRRRESLA